MAKTFRSRRFLKKRAPRRGRKTARRSGDRILRVPGTLAPSHMLVPLKYIQTLGKAAPAGKVSMFNQFRCNSIWDPDHTNTFGTSCLGLIQWRNFYQRYRVYKFAYKLTFSNLSADSVLTGAVVPANYLDTSYSWSDIMRPMAQRFEIGNREGQNKTVVRGVVNLPKLAGVTATQYKSDVNNLAGFGADPSNPLYITVILANSNLSLPANIVCQVEFTYYTEMMALNAGMEALDKTTNLAVVPGTDVCTLPEIL